MKEKRCWLWEFCYFVRCKSYADACDVARRVKGPPIVKCDDRAGIGDEFDVGKAEFERFHHPEGDVGLRDGDDLKWIYSAKGGSD